MNLLETVASEEKQEDHQKSLETSPLRESLSRDAHYNNLDSIFSFSISKSLDPTKNLAARFNAWKALLKEFITYFKAVINIEEVKANEFKKLSSLLNICPDDKCSFQDGGIQEVQKVFCEWNRKYSTYLSTVPNNVNSDIILKLERVRTMLGERVKDILKMSYQFRSNLSKETDLTRKLMEVYKESLLRWESNPEKITCKTDPYLIKRALEKQITQTLLEENALQRAYLNIESYCRDIEKNVIDTVRQVFSEYKDVLHREVAFISDFNKNIGVADDAISLDKGWNSFIKEDPMFKVLIDD